MRSLRRPRGTSNRQPPQPTKKSWRDPVDLTARLFVAWPRFGRSTHGENKKILMQSLWMSAHVSNDYRVDLSSRNALWDTSSEDRVPGGRFRKKSHTTDHSQAHTLHKHIPCTSASEIDTCDLGASPATRLSWNAQAANKSPPVNPCFCARASEANTTSKSKVVIRMLPSIFDRMCELLSLTKRMTRCAARTAGPRPIKRRRTNGPNVCGSHLSMMR